jgi:hypothetical protein
MLAAMVDLCLLSRQPETYSFEHAKGSRGSDSFLYGWSWRCLDRKLRVVAWLKVNPVDIRSWGCRLALAERIVCRPDRGLVESVAGQPTIKKCFGKAQEAMESEPDAGG